MVSDADSSRNEITNDFPRPTVERMNAYAPQHSRIFKEVSSSSTSTTALAEFS